MRKQCVPGASPFFARAGDEAILSLVCFQAFQESNNTFQRRCRRSGWSGKAGPLLRGSLVSFSDCNDSLRTRRLGESPLLCVYAFLVIVHALLPADQEPGAARTDCISTHAF